MAAVLQDGRVLVVGGLNAPDLNSPAEIYDPATDTWSTVGTPIVPGRHAGKMVVTKDGRVLIAGGEVSCQTGQFFSNGQFQDCAPGRPIASPEVEVFNPADASFHLVGTSAHGRTGATLTLLPDGTALLLGGSEFDFENAKMKIYSDGDIYNPTTGEYRRSWMNMILPRFAHTATVDSFGYLVITGGISSSGHAISRNEYYVGHDAICTYEINSFLSGGIASHHAYRIDSGEIVFFGGVSTSNGVDGWNRVLVTFRGSDFPGSALDPNPISYADNATAQLPDTRVLVGGGLLLDSSATSQIFVLNPTSRQFEPYREMSEPRTHFTLSALKDGSLLVVGGRYDGEWGDSGIDSAERIY